MVTLTALWNYLFVVNLEIFLDKILKWNHVAIIAQSMQRIIFFWTKLAFLVIFIIIFFQFLFGP